MIMKRFTTPSVVLRRTDYGEADRIVTILTPQRGKQVAIAKAVRRPRSKLAAGIEPFSINAITLLEGRRGMGTIVSARCERVFGDILTDYDRLSAGYRAIKLIDKVTEDSAEEDYFTLLTTVFASLHSGALARGVTMAWFHLQFLNKLGYLPSLTHLTSGQRLEAASRYDFIIENGEFVASQSGVFGESEIKAWRILSQTHLMKIPPITGLEAAVEASGPTLERFVDYQVQ